MKNMKCTEIKNRLSAYQDGELAAPTFSLIADHLKICPSCREELERLRKAYAMIAIDHLILPDPFFLTRLRARIQTQNKKLFVRSNSLHWLERMLLPATVMVGLLFGTFLGMQMTKKFFSQTTSGIKISESYLDQDVFAEIPSGSLTDSYTSLNHWEQDIFGRQP
jgi:predicted anti-sigma-YlaC factor YlaD